MTHEDPAERPEVRIPVQRLRCGACIASLDVPQFPGIETCFLERCVFCGQAAAVELAEGGPVERIGRHVEEPSSEERFHDLFRWWAEEEVRREIREHWTFRGEQRMANKHAYCPPVPFTPPEVFVSKAWARCVYLPFWLREDTGPGEAPALVYAGHGLPEALLRELDLRRCLEAAPPAGTAQLDLPVEPVAGEAEAGARLVEIPLWIAAYVEDGDAFRLLQCPRTGQHVAFEPPLTDRQRPDGRRWVARQAIITVVGLLLIVALVLFVEGSCGNEDAAPPPPAPIPGGSAPPAG